MRGTTAGAWCAGLGESRGGRLRVCRCAKVDACGGLSTPRRWFVLVGSGGGGGICLRLPLRVAHRELPPHLAWNTPLTMTRGSAATAQVLSQCLLSQASQWCSSRLAPYEWFFKLLRSRRITCIHHAKLSRRALWRCVSRMAEEIRCREGCDARLHSCSVHVLVLTRIRRGS